MLLFPSDELDTSPSPAVPEADQSSSEPAAGKDDDTAPAWTITAPVAETVEALEQPSSGAVIISDFETVAYCKKPAAHI